MAKNLVDNYQKTWGTTNMSGMGHQFTFLRTPFTPPRMI